MTLSPFTFVIAVLLGIPLMMFSWPLLLGSIVAAAFRPTGGRVYLLGIAIGALHAAAALAIKGRMDPEAFVMAMLSSQLASIILVGGVSWMLRKFRPRQKPSGKDVS